ncbi:MAG: MarR family transcriptional regulator [Patulibacter sp.]|nr:MarR family transcriptional regulator [Patulibacter sp.]
MDQAQLDGNDGEDPVSVLAELLARTARAIHFESRRLLAPLGLTPAAARTLRTLARSEEPLRMVDIAERMHVVPRTVTTVIDALEAEQLIERRAAPNDRRSTYVHLTPLAHERLRLMLEARRDAAGQLLAALEPDEQEQLRGLLERLVPPVDDCRR